MGADAGQRPPRVPTRPRRTPGRARGRSRGSRRSRGRASGDATSAVRRRASGRASRARASSWSTTQRGPSPGNSVIASMPGRDARARRRSCRTGDSTSFSAKQKPILPGMPWVARSTSPGRPPPTLRITSCSARPIVELARLPCPSALPPEFIPIARRAGTAAHDHRSDRHRRGEQAVDVELVGARGLDRGRAPTGRYSGLQPAITAAIATFSTVASTRSGGTTATTSDGARVRARQHRASRAPRSAARPAARRSSRGRTSSRCRPRRRPRRCAATRARDAPNRTRSASTRSGSTLIDPQPGRNTGRPSPRPVTPVMRSHSGRCQPTVRSTSTPSTTRSTVGTVSISWCQLIARSRSSSAASASPGKSGSSCVYTVRSQRGVELAEHRHDHPARLAFALHHHDDPVGQRSGASAHSQIDRSSGWSELPATHVTSAELVSDDTRPRIVRSSGVHLHHTPQPTGCASRSTVSVVRRRATARRSSATAATRRASRSTFPGTSRSCSTSAPGCATSGSTCSLDQPFPATCLLSHLHWDHIQGLPFFKPLLARRLRRLHLRAGAGG